MLKPHSEAHLGTVHTQAHTWSYWRCPPPTAPAGFWRRSSVAPLSWRHWPSPALLGGGSSSSHGGTGTRPRPPWTPAESAGRGPRPNTAVTYSASEWNAAIDPPCAVKMLLPRLQPACSQIHVIFKGLKYKRWLVCWYISARLILNHHTTQKHKLYVGWHPVWAAGERFCCQVATKKILVCVVVQWNLKSFS